MFAVRVGNPSECRVGLLFTDITEARVAANERDVLLETLAVAMRWLQTSVQRGLVNHPLLAHYDRTLDSLRERSDFRDLLQRVQREMGAPPGSVS